MMPSKTLKFGLSASFFAISMTLLISSTASAAEVTIRKPTIDGYRLDWCRDWGTNCGKAAADRYCELMGHARATKFKIASDIGDRTPTRVVNDRKVCSEKFCDGFSYVRCKPKVARLGNPNNYIPKKQKTPAPVLEDNGKADGGFTHTSAANVLRRYDALADGAVRAIAQSSSVNANSLISTIENRCVEKSAACHLELKLKFLNEYLSQ